MPGRISVSFRREPDFFAAGVVEGAFCQTIVARDRSSRRIVAVASRSVRRRFVNGRPTPIGYLSALRILPSHRNGTILARGYRFLRELNEDRRTNLYLTTIVESNQRAVTLLTSGRAGLPQYHAAGSYHTLAIPVPRSQRAVEHATGSLRIRPGNATDADTIVNFLQQVGRTRQFFPCYTKEEFFNDRGTFRGLSPTDLLLAFRKGRLVGTLGAWNQSGFRQTVVEQYNGMLKWIRPIYNIRSKLLGRSKLPAPGRPFGCRMAALPLVQDHDSEVFTALLRRLVTRAATAANDYILLGLHETDPLLTAAARFATTSFVTQLYHVCWDDEKTTHVECDDRPVYLEVGSL